MSSKNKFVQLLQKQIDSDIENAKRGLLDDLALRERIKDSDADPSDPFVQLTVWLCALVNGVIDDLEVSISDKKGSISIQITPKIIEKQESRKAPIINLPIPGPFDSSQSENTKVLPSG